MRVRRSTLIRPRIAYACVVSLLALSARAGRAQSLSVSGSPQTMSVNSVVSAGMTPKPDTETTTSYTVRTTSGNRKKITARLFSAMPAGTSLTIQFSPVAGSVAVGTVTLSTIAQTVLTNISTTTARTGTITYALNATLAAGEVSTRSRFVIFTLADYP